jgi:hypothetical protein
VCSSDLDTIVKQIDAVRQDEIQAIAQELFVEKKLSTVIFVPEGKSAGRLPASESNGTTRNRGKSRRA